MQVLKSCASVAIGEPGNIFYRARGLRALIKTTAGGATPRSEPGPLAFCFHNLRYLKQQITRAVHSCHLPRMEQQRGRRTFHYRRTDDAVARPQQLHTEYRVLDELLEINLASPTRALRIRAFPIVYLELWLIRFPSSPLQ